MAAYDNSGSVEGENVSTVSFAFTTAGSDRALVGNVHIEDDPTAAVVSTITYNSVSLGAAQSNVLNPNYQRVQQFAMAGPTSGSNTFAVTLNNAATYHLVLGAVSATAVNQTTPVRAGSVTTQSADTASPSVDVPSATGDLVVDAIQVGQTGNPGIAPSAGALQTQRYTQVGPYSGNGGSTEPGAATVTMSWSVGAANTPECAFSALSLQDVGGAAPVSLVSRPGMPVAVMLSLN